MMSNRPGREIPKEYREIVNYQIDQHGWRYDATRKGHPQLIPADRTQRKIPIPTTPGDPRHLQLHIQDPQRGRRVATRKDARMTGYSVTLEVTAVGHSPVDARIDDPAVDQHLSDFLDRLAKVWGAVSGDGRGWSATVTVDADTIDVARELATATVLEQAAACGLPTRPVTRVEVVREDIRDAELERPTLPDLVSGPEAAEILGVSRQRVHQLAHQHPDFPAPAYRLGVGSLWFRAGVERFGRDWSRKPGRPARKSA